MTSACFVSGWKSIGAVFGVSARVARQWMDEGAPVVMVTGSMPCACLAELWAWLKDRKKERPSSDLPVNSMPVDLERPKQGKAVVEQERNPEITLKGRECPFCASVDSLRKYGEQYRCEWCRQTFTKKALMN